MPKMICNTKMKLSTLIIIILILSTILFLGIKIINSWVFIKQSQTMFWYSSIRTDQNCEMNNNKIKCWLKD